MLLNKGIHVKKLFMITTLLLCSWTLQADTYEELCYMEKLCSQLFESAVIEEDFNMQCYAMGMYKAYSHARNLMEKDAYNILVYEP